MLSALSRVSRSAPRTRAPIMQQAMNMAQYTGTCKWFDATKGFGFITPNEPGDDVFVHQTAIHAEGFRSLAEGEPLEYDVVQENGKTKADNVTGPDGDYVRGAPRPEPRDYPPRRDYY